PSLASIQPEKRLDVLIFAAGPSALDGVWRRGRQVVSGGRHHARDAIAARYGATLRRLLA
ncbi:MAG: formimidoylglutamate deiminase, partial [Proteobacteria bacterium]|nr:formimidoylglutamate deiminase [Pseudomonadota bacterium]